MKLRRLEVSGFAQFDRVEVTFRDDVPNLIEGPNEAGKSHLMQALYGMLFGLEQPERFKPWFGEPTGMHGVLEFDDDSAHAIRLERNFESNEITVSEDGAAPWTAVVGPRTRLSQAERYFACLERWLGFQDVAIFSATTFVRQTELAQASLKGVAPQLKQLVTGSPQSDFQQALGELRTELDTLRQPPDKRAPRQIQLKEQELLELEEQYREARRREDSIASLQERRRRTMADISSRLQRSRETRTQLHRFKQLVDRESELERLKEQFDDMQRRLHQFVRAHEKIELARNERGEYAALETTDLVTLLQLEHAVRDAEQQLEVARQQAAARGTLWRDVLFWLPIFGCVVLAIYLGLAVDHFLVLVGLVSFFYAAFRLGYLGKPARRSPDFIDIETAERRISDAKRERARVFEAIGVSSVEETVTLRKTYEFKDRDLEKALSALQALGDESEVEERFRAVKFNLARERDRVDDMLDSDVSLRLVGSAAKRAERAAELQRELDRLDAEIEERRATEAQIERELLMEGADEKDVTALFGRIQGLQQEIAILRRRAAALTMAIQTLQECVEQFQSVAFVDVLADASSLLASMTNGRYTRVSVDNAELEPFVDMPDRDHIPGASLSRGVQDQLYFSLRVALARALSGGRSLPLILDDPYVNLDQSRLERAIGLLHGLAQRTQVILFTCDVTYEQWFEPVLRLQRREPESAERQFAR